MDAWTDHQIAAFGPDRMMLLDTTNGEILVDAQRGTDGVWTVTATGATDITVNPDPQPNTDGLNESPTYRAGVIQAMTDQALASQPGTGYSTLIPHGLPETP